MEIIFRSLLVAKAILDVLLWSMPYIDYMWFTNEQLHLLDQSGLGAMYLGSELAYWAELMVWLVLCIGLFFYIRAARIGFLIFYGFVIARSLFNGVQVFSPYESAISIVLGLVDGAILAMVYLTSISARFERRLLTNQSSRPL